jgi:putative transposase
VWAAEATNVVELLDDAAVLEKMAYVVANPTAAGLVRKPKQWPGLLTTRLCEVRKVGRPRVFFSERTALPRELTLRFTWPDIYRGVSTAALNKMLADRVAVLVRQAHTDLTDAGRTFLGVKGVLRQAPSREASTEETRRTLSPRIATKSPSLRRRALRQLKEFWTAYREALTAWRGGCRDVVFPLGSYEVRVVHGARCAPAG